MTSRKPTSKYTKPVGAFKGGQDHASQVLSSQEVNNACLPHPSDWTHSFMGCSIILKSGSHSHNCQMSLIFLLEESFPHLGRWGKRWRWGIKRKIWQRAEISYHIIHSHGPLYFYDLSLIHANIHWVSMYQAHGEPKERNT